MAVSEQHKALTAHLRGRIKQSGIKARVYMTPGLVGDRIISVSVPSFEARFTAEQIEAFCLAAKVNRLTFVRGCPIDPTQEALLTEKMQWNFYMAEG